MAGQQPPRTGLSLYANLLEPEGDSTASISRGPVVSQEALDAVKEQEASKKPIDSALRFQPHPQIRRPQQKTQKPKASFPKAPLAPPTALDVASPGTAQAPSKSRLADWAPTEEDEFMYGLGEKRARGGRRKKKKKEREIPIETDWDEIYDPSRPTNVIEYLRSDERIREVREWKDLLYKHRRRDDDSERRGSWSSEEEDARPIQNQFAPPDSYSFAPPPPSPPRASVPDDKTGDDAYARRLALSQGNAPPPPRSPSPPPPPPLLAAPPEPEAPTISRAPVRYTESKPASESRAPRDPDAMDEDEDEYVPPEPEAEETRSSRPGQKGFAARLMAKYGWSKGQGLGAEASGILQPLRVQVEKRKKKSDAEGGGWAEPGGKGRIIGSKTGTGTQSESSGGKFGSMSNVVVLRNMLDGMEDLQAEMESGLGQEIGEECGDKYGRVERLYIDVEGRRVYIKFTDQVSALRAVNALDGRIFAGNTIEPQFYDVDKFERRVYE
ncbi:uncharacterized protein GGS22DRAFT_131420 [Annulohypoxylon maeteangense]|uniref:uncharacterized protein n=1 Tax=Annulohypoxylon maeteangense TaxID=1927788 RepID=UPI002008E6DD|nr:uncharacterized protein GGS22DRAFT_131420 [Annulohypoxylon maeteangense]KAI0885624.1 hypothetical protein GGS22DRAFT_131420 [Annulohypoxylon maeteangense]